MIAPDVPSAERCRCRHLCVFYRHGRRGCAQSTTMLSPRLRAAQADAPPDPIKTIVDRLDLEKYKATIKGLTQFGDRRQGTERNRAAVDWIEAQLKSYGCTNTERIQLRLPAAAASAAAGAPRHAATRAIGTQGGGARRAATAHADRRQHRSAEAARREAPRAQRAADDARPARGGLLHEGRHDASRRDVHRRRRTWTASAGAKPPTTTAPAPRW